MKKEADRSEGDINISDLRKKWQKKHLHSSVKELLERDAEYFIHQSLSTPCLNVLRAAKGPFIEDTQGRRYYDFHGNSVHQLGYGHPEVLDAVKKQLDTLPFCPRRYTNHPAIRLAERLAELTPGDLKHSLFAPGGTEAVGIALKIARLHTGSFRTVSWWDSFHGASLDSIGVGGEGVFRKYAGPLMPGAIHIPPPGWKKNNNSPIEDPDYLEYIIEREGQIGAFIAEPLRCTSVKSPPDGYWKRIREICDRNKILLIFDEIPLCLGRTGHLFASEATGVVPDILVSGKGLGGGIFPMAAVTVSEKIKIPEESALGHYTHEKSPVGAAAALASLNIIGKKSFLENVKILSKLAARQLEEMKKEFPIISEIRVFGLLIGIELEKHGEKAVHEAEKILYESLSGGLSFKVSSGNILTLAPPLTIKEEELADALKILEQAFRNSV